MIWIIKWVIPVHFPQRKAPALGLLLLYTIVINKLWRYYKAPVFIRRVSSFSLETLRIFIYFIFTVYLIDQVQYFQNMRQDTFHEEYHNILEYFQLNPFSMSTIYKDHFVIIVFSSCSASAVQLYWYVYCESTRPIGSVAMITRKNQ